MARMDMSTLEKAEIAAQTGAADALFELGLLYCTGRDVEMDLVTAHKWFNLAAVRGNKAALEYRLELAREMSQCDVAKAQKEAREWLATH
jgi:TPR repeat protein